MLQLLALARENAALTRELILSRENDATLRELLAAIHETWTGRACRSGDSCGATGGVAACHAHLEWNREGIWLSRRAI